ncbi:MAG: hypothetical protein A3J60_00410 [Candidatus Pacebacteria bacterium RIFCSPHIGHO2_02_FULL_46_9]|nr:MAG: hypothetical protein A3J60_00410 [Candidatus Pacebacteria bacterium RIFCSPHIGHO2_02_FULL_46_9]
MSEESPRLSLPVETEWVTLLKEKADDYRARIDRRKRKNFPPELRNAQVEYALLILIQLLSGSTVESFALSRELADLQGNNFDVDNFQQACAAVDKYTTDRKFLEQHLAS